jgi:flagellar basal body-associated protein FliL
MAVEEEKPTGETAAVPAPAETAKKSGVIKWAIVGAILLLFIGIEVGIAVFFVERLKHESEPPVTVAQPDEKKESLLKVGATLAAPIEVTVNIFGEDGRYVKCGVQLEYDADNVLLGPELENRKGRIKDIIIDIMSSQPLHKLMTNDGKKEIREEIVNAVNAELPDSTSKGKSLGEKVSRSYFDSFLIQ